MRVVAGEYRFDEPPAGCEICIVLRHCPDGDDYGVDRKRMPLSYLAKSCAQQFDVIRQQRALPLRQIDREEEAPARG